MISDFLRWVSVQPWYGYVHIAGHILGLILYTVAYLLLCGKYKQKKLPIFLLAISVGVTGYMSMKVSSWIHSSFTSFTGGNIVRVVYFFPVLVYAFSKLYKLDWRASQDMLGITVCVNIFFSRFGCVLAGCSSGYPSNFGVYSPSRGINCFPIQFIELAVLAIIGLLLYWREKGKAFQPDGLGYPLFLILYGSTRFILEFARWNEKLFFGISELALNALWDAVVGVVLYLLISHWNASAAKEKNCKKDGKKG